MNRPPRVLSALGPTGSGPLLIVVGGLHGNEPGGVLASREVAAEVEAAVTAGCELGGRFVALSGNRGALEAGERYLDRDLNRMWAGVELARSAEDDGDGPAPRERAEQRELKAAIDTELALASGEVCLLDLHSTSAPGAPFCIVGDEPRTLTLASSIGAPLLLGLEGTVAGTLLAHFGAAGRVAMCLEGGENESVQTVRHHAAAIRLLLVALGIVPERVFPGIESDRAVMRNATNGLPPRIEVRYRHALVTGERFAMRPGFTNFQAVAAGDLLAHSDRAGGIEVRAPFGGLLVMPRYQGRGEDGFFLGLPVDADGRALAR